MAEIFTSGQEAKSAVTVAQPLVVILSRACGVQKITPVHRGLVRNVCGTQHGVAVVAVRFKGLWMDDEHTPAFKLPFRNGLTK